MASIHRDPQNRSPYWYAAFTLADGTRRFRSTKTKDRKAAQALAIEWERLGRDVAEQDPTGAQIAKVARDIYERTTGVRLERAQVGQYLRLWAERTGISAAKRTALRYRQVVSDFLAHLGELREKASLTSITPKDVQEFVTSEIESGKSPTTVKIVVKVLRIPFNHAMRHGLILINPVATVELPQIHAQQRKAFSWAQVRMLVESANGDWKTAILLGAYCGMRLGDCINLRWSNVDFIADTIKYVPEKTSRGNRRKELTVPLHPSLREHLEKIASSDTTDQRLCPSLQGRSSSGRSGLSGEFINTIMREAGIDLLSGDRSANGKGRKFNQLSFHSLRHTFNSQLANEGVSQELRRVLTGHATDAMNDKYSHFEAAALAKAVAKLPSTNAA